MLVKLSPSEMMLGAHSGIMRHVQNVQKKRHNLHGLPKENGADWQMHIEGALAEMAVAKTFDLYYSGKGRFGNPDTSLFEIRSSPRHDASLIVHLSDLDESLFVLVTGMNGFYTIRGWLYGYDAKIDKYWKEFVEGRPAYFVPQSDLMDIKALDFHYALDEMHTKSS